ncbi:MAG: hypothetical protein DMG95_02105 [Acidobacteria bacterium]|nr:MAG: hypothetical protein DMG95_02105 [Acidobacteriota bacterium]
MRQVLTIEPLGDRVIGSSSDLKLISYSLVIMNSAAESDERGTLRCDWISRGARGSKDAADIESVIAMVAGEG